MDQDTIIGLILFLILAVVIWWLYQKFCAANLVEQYEIPSSDPEVQFFRFVFEAFDKSKQVKGRRFYQVMNLNVVGQDTSKLIGTMLTDSTSKLGREMATLELSNTLLEI